jgi:hypothetical protein
MLSLICLVIMGLVFGFLMPLWSFASFSLIVLVGYAVFATGFSGLGRVYRVIFAGIALQVGYFIAVLICIVWPRLLESAGRETTVGSKAEQQESDETSPQDSHSQRAK